jgi:hypothetical protein
MRTEDYRKSLFKRLKDPEYAVGYLTEVLANESQGAFLIALKDIIQFTEFDEENLPKLEEERSSLLVIINKIKKLIDHETEIYISYRGKLTTEALKKEMLQAIKENKQKISEAILSIKLSNKLIRKLGKKIEKLLNKITEKQQFVAVSNEQLTMLRKRKTENAEDIVEVETNQRIAKKSPTIEHPPHRRRSSPLQSTV